MPPTVPKTRRARLELADSVYSSLLFGLENLLKLGIGNFKTVVRLGRLQRLAVLAILRHLVDARPRFPGRFRPTLSLDVAGFLAPVADYAPRASACSASRASSVTGGCRLLFTLFTSVA